MKDHPSEKGDEKMSDEVSYKDMWDELREILRSSRREAMKDVAYYSRTEQVPGLSDACKEILAIDHALILMRYVEDKAYGRWLEVGRIEK